MCLCRSQLGKCFCTPWMIQLEAACSIQLLTRGSSCLRDPHMSHIQWRTISKAADLKSLHRHWPHKRSLPQITGLKEDHFKCFIRCQLAQYKLCSPKDMGCKFSCLCHPSNSMVMWIIRRQTYLSKAEENIQSVTLYNRHPYFHYNQLKLGHIELKVHHQCYHCHSILLHRLIHQDQHLLRCCPVMMFNQPYSDQCTFDRQKITTFIQIHFAYSHLVMWSCKKSLLLVEGNNRCCILLNHHWFLMCTPHTKHLIVGSLRSRALVMCRSIWTCIYIHLDYRSFLHWGQHTIGITPVLLFDK